MFGVCMTVLYIEDDYEYHNMIDFMLQSLNVKVLHAYSVQEGIDVLKSNNINFILSDINMAGMDGLSFLAAIKKDKLLSKIPIVIVTGDPSGEKAKFANEQGAVGFLAKPFTQNELVYLVQTFGILGNFYSIDESTEDVLMRKKQKLMMMLAKDSLERDFGKACQSFLNGLNDIFGFEAIAYYKLIGDGNYMLSSDNGKIQFLQEFKTVSRETNTSLAHVVDTKEDYFSNDALHVSNPILKSWVNKHNLITEVVLPFLNLDDRDFLLGAGLNRSALTVQGFFWGFRNGIFSSKEIEVLKRLSAQGNPILSHLSNIGQTKKFF